MSHKSSILFLGAVLAVLGAGCEGAFTPKGPYQDRMVVYGILTNRADTQYVRIHTTYNPAGFDPLTVSEESVVRDADVKVAESSKLFTFRQGTASRRDKSRYNDDVTIYISYPFSLEAGKTYDLTVSSPRYGTVTSSVTVPRRGRVQIFNSYVLNGRGTADEDLVIYGWIRELTYGVLARLYLIYETQEGDTWVRHTDEVPSSMVKYDDGTKEFFYPNLRRRESPGVIREKEVTESFVFSRTAYVERLNDLFTRYPSGRLRIKYGLIILTQVDQNFYRYSKIVHGFEDPYSIRTDTPDFTNIAGGRGIFGAMVEDSLLVELSF
ncbi:MAG TPA: hypothetical protein DEP53_10490 [Bacteroidetes bacterium]|nr:MAG: hypothetical protein A2X66_00250 [Ignavibacteria bacterium GWA2_54_16]HCA80150.1 hypothetical protein [Bacteroidota bacterium]